MRKLSRPSPLMGEVAVPGDKSISHRALILGALAPGVSRITGLNGGRDVAATADALRAFGAKVTWAEGSHKAVVEGYGSAGLREPEAVVDAGNSGTTLRCLLAVAARVAGLSVFTGDDSLRRRPMLRVVAPLRQMGATIDGRAHGDRAPLVVRGGSLTGLDIELPVASAQVKTALLLAGMGAAGPTRVVEPGGSRDHTERMLADLGAPLVVTDGAVELAGAWEPPPADRTVPGDISSAMFLLAAALLVGGSELRLTGVGLNPTRSAVLDVLTAMGAELTVERSDIWGGEPVGSVTARASELRGVTCDPAAVPALIDEIPILAVLATQAEGVTEISGAAELRVKESDRIEALRAGLTTLGAEVEGRPDGLVITGPTRLSGGDVDAHGDHRIAMAFAVAGLVASGKVRVKGWSAVETSFPEFLGLLAAAQGKR